MFPDWYAVKIKGVVIVENDAVTIGFFLLTHKMESGFVMNMVDEFNLKGLCNYKLFDLCFIQYLAVFVLYAVSCLGCSEICKEIKLSLITFFRGGINRLALNLLDLFDLLFCQDRADDQEYQNAAAYSDSDITEDRSLGRGSLGRVFRVVLNLYGIA